MDRQARHARHAGAGEAAIRAERHTRAAAHGHHHHHTNTTTAITTNMTPTPTSSTAAPPATATTTTTAKPKSSSTPPPAGGDPTWNGSASNLWGTAGNWTPNAIPGAADTATFSGSSATVNGNTTISLNGQSILTIVFDTANAAAYTLGSGGVGNETLTLSNSGAITVNSTVTNNQLFNANLTMGSDGTSATSFTFTNNGTGTLTFAGNLSEAHANNSNPARTLNLAGSGNGVISGIIDGNGASNGSNARPLVSLVKSGTGTWTLSGTNTYTGTTTVSAGSLIAGTDALNNANGAFGKATTAIVLGDAATTTNNSSPSLLTGGAFTIGRAVTVANQATTGTYTIGGNTDNNSTFGGLVTINQNLTVSQVATTGANALSITGGITSGTAPTRKVTFAGPGAINVGTTAIGGGTGILNVAVTGGTTTFNFANNYSGNTAISAGGTLKSAIANALGSTSGIDVSNTGSLLLSASNTINDAATMTLSGNVATNNPATKNLVLSGASEGSSTTTTATAGLGALTLLSRSTLDFLQSTSTIVFGQTAGTAFVDSGAFKLDIYNYVGDSTPTGNLDHLVFQQNMSGLTGDFEFWNGSSFVAATATQLGSSGFWEITPVSSVPEPSTWVAGALALTSLVACRGGVIRRRACHAVAMRRRVVQRLQNRRT